MRKWESTKAERYAERHWKENGYTFSIKREYASKTIYTVSKNGVELEYTISSDITDPKGDMKHFEKQFEMYSFLKSKGAF
jgi:pyocin large subunit-like protein